MFLIYLFQDDASSKFEGVKSFMFSNYFSKFQYPVFRVFSVSPLIKKKKKILVDEVGKMRFKD